MYVTGFIFSQAYVREYTLETRYSFTSSDVATKHSQRHQSGIKDLADSKIQGYEQQRK